MPKRRITFGIGATMLLFCLSFFVLYTNVLRGDTGVYNGGAGNPSDNQYVLSDEEIIERALALGLTHTNETPQDEPNITEPETESESVLGSDYDFYEATGELETIGESDGNQADGESAEGETRDEDEADEDAVADEEFADEFYTDENDEQVADEIIGNETDYSETDYNETIDENETAVHIADGASEAAADGGQDADGGRPDRTPSWNLIEGNRVSVIIPDGNDAANIAAVLHRAGVIQSQRRFLDILREFNYTTFMRSGTFELVRGTDYEELADRLVSPRRRRVIEQVPEEDYADYSDYTDDEPLFYEPLLYDEPVSYELAPYEPTLDEAEPYEPARESEPVPYESFESYESFEPFDEPTLDEPISYEQTYREDNPQEFQQDYGDYEEHEIRQDYDLNHAEE